jgi:uncharacterized protein YfaA (DUF2138 family)
MFPNKNIHLELQKDAKPFHGRPYPLPKRHEQVFKDELQHFCDIGVLKRCGLSKWLLHLCFIAKKDSRVCWISNFRELNNVKYYWLPMGICQSPNIAQEEMKDHLRQFEEAHVYINDIRVFSNNLSSLTKSRLS